MGTTRAKRYRCRGTLSLQYISNITVSDNTLRRQFKEFAPSFFFRSDAILLGGSGAEDNTVIVVEELHGNDGAFVARIEISQFRLCMRVIKGGYVEIITRGTVRGVCRPDAVPDFLCGLVGCSG